MSIKDYNKKYVIVNGTTNTQKVVPKSTNDYEITIPMTINQFLLFNEVIGELNETESVTIFKSYMKD